MVYLEGTPSGSIYRNSDGQPAADFALRITSLQLLGSKPETTELSNPKSEPAAAKVTADLEVPD
ncbi:hypothetical protein [Flavilitoribacter nigricans]|uniref:Uncharacterized protein n=1 Tax=Flavilitoribacter nigricans (strain ATCC 23147 / DSM 23189 / NBRC 102662 / NCIMB 1420 / SS-2) TaxID=1122177 RepID=A0A2D0N7H0_FLAN2|nr:hypothetical protein [Flavilitoribacter nigricans]PHN04330.1 hypothetical protein CRP01_22475 [Flavilitoribacter nigricans DSM 23189 = NBRC 102662]